MAPAPRETSRSAALSRRAALTLPLALGGCGLWDGWFGEEKTPIPGKREPVLATTNNLKVESGAPKVALPPAVRNAAWPQTCGNPAHLMGHLQAQPVISQAWRAAIGDGGGYRQKVLAQPVVAGGLVYTMDSTARVSCFSLSDGQLRWRVNTKSEESRSNNVGGGLGVADGILYAVNGLGDVVALDAATGKQKWRINLGVPGRSGPTIVAGRIFVMTIDDRLVTLDAATGHQLWQYKAINAITAMLGEPAPAYSDGLVVAGFASGELTALRADTGTVLWTDNLIAAGVGAGLLDIYSIRGVPAISGSRVFAISMGGMAVANDLHSGRRLWEHSVSGLDSPWVAGDWVFLLTVDQTIAAINADDGTIAWVKQLPRWGNPKKQRDPITWFGPLLASDRLVVAGTSKAALAVSPYSGEILGMQKLPGVACPLQPVIADGTLLLIADDGQLTALR
jgi:outer membrane protein assembly factor BamB